MSNIENGKPKSTEPQIPQAPEEINTSAQPKPPQTPKLPICPYCLHEPFRPQAVPFMTPTGVRLLILFCEDCRKVVNMLILEMPQPRIQAPQRRVQLQ